MLEEQILKTIKKYQLIDSGDNIVIGVSGGPDSIALLTVLNKYKKDLNINIVVAHINHMIRSVADEETKYVEEYCKKLNIEIYVKKVSVIELSQDNKIGTEEMGRKIRYEFFEEVLEKTNSNKIVTAHNLNDNAETVLMNILRGTSITGLKGIEKKRDNKFIRPLIECDRKDIEEYCEKNNLNPKYDESNKENIYTRNKVRNLLIPYIEKEFNPNIISTINRLSDLATKENDFIEEIVENEYEKIFVEEREGIILLDLKKFNLLNDVIKSRIIMYTINKVLGNVQGIEKIHIEDIIKMCKKNIGNKFLTPNKNIKVEINNKKIFFKKLL